MNYTNTGTLYAGKQCLHSYVTADRLKLSLTLNNKSVFNQIVNGKVTPAKNSKRNVCWPDSTSLQHCCDVDM